MHSKRHRQQRQRIEAIKFQRSNGLRAQPIFAFRWGGIYAWRLDVAVEAEKRKHELASGAICEGLHRTKLPCGNYDVTGNPVTVRLAPR